MLTPSRADLQHAITGAKLSTQNFCHGLMIALHTWMRIEDTETGRFV